MRRTPFCPFPEQKTARLRAVGDFKKAAALVRYGGMWAHCCTALGAPCIRRGAQRHGRVQSLNFNGLLGLHNGKIVSLKIPIPHPWLNPCPTKQPRDCQSRGEVFHLASSKQLFASGNSCTIQITLVCLHRRSMTAVFGTRRSSDRWFVEYAIVVSHVLSRYLSLPASFEEMIPLEHTSPSDSLSK